MSAALVQSVYVNPLVLLTWWSNFISMKLMYYYIFFNLFLYFLEQNFKNNNPTLYTSQTFTKNKSTILQQECSPQRLEKVAK